MARWHSCNVLQLNPNTRRVWQFDGQKFNLNREFAARDGEPLPQGVKKDWRALFQPSLNVAWLPPEHVFLRVAQFPQAAPDELRSMVELQLEKLSPIPVTQALWTMQVVDSGTVVAPAPAATEGNAAAAPIAMQTIVVIVVARNVVEEFLGTLEKQGFMADRLELPLLDQIRGQKITEDGAWIYPDDAGRNTAIVAWWYRGALQNLDLLTLPTGGNRADAIKEQLMQMAWAGELEGWLTSPPTWHLVADASRAPEWEPVLRDALQQQVDVSAPLPAIDLAARTAQRAAERPAEADLLPIEFAHRYKQQFQDRLWLGALVATFALYGIGLAIYFVALTVLKFQTTTVEKQVAGLAPSFTNSIQLEAKSKILKEQQDLKFAALDCWKAVADLLPTSINLDSMNFTDGKRLTLKGSAPADQVGTIYDFTDKLRKVTKDGVPLFSVENVESPRTSLGAGNMVTWTFALDMKRTEKQ